MSRLLVTESSEEHKVSTSLAPVTTERNRLMSWHSTVQRIAKPGGVIPSSKSSITLKPFGLISKMIRAIFAPLAKLPYSLFKLGFEIAKLVTRVLSNIRRLLFTTK